MKTVTRVFCAAVCALALLWAAALTAPAAHAEPAYQDGDYTVAFSMDGLGRHNVAWDTATVHVKGGALYVDFTLERIDPRDHAPQYDWLKTEYGSFTPALNDAAFTCTFTGVQVPHLGTVNVTAMTSAMSQPYEVEYVLHIDDSAIPVVSDTPAQQEPQPAQPEQPAQPDQPVSQPGGDDLLVQQPGETTAPPDGTQDSAAEVPDDALTTGSEPADGEDTMEITSVQPDEETLAAGPGGLSPAAIAAIAAGAVVIIGGGAVIARMKKGKNDEK